LLFASLLPPPPASTLFPYTTLFRSLADGLVHLLLGLIALLVVLGIQVLGRLVELLLVASQFLGAVLGLLDALRVRVSILLPAALDRKSTRLNSSHDQISYAVFCLKK